MTERSIDTTDANLPDVHRLRDLRSAVILRSISRHHSSPDRRHTSRIAWKSLLRLIMLKRISGAYGEAVRLKSLETQIHRLTMPAFSWNQAQTK